MIESTQPTQTPLETIEARYKDLLYHLGVQSHDGAVYEIKAIRSRLGLGYLRIIVLLYLTERFCMMINQVSLDSKNRMLRIGFGKNDGRWFIRIDLWFVGFRLTTK
jgi:hypothetical protein